jgi:hypothetical protein
VIDVLAIVSKIASLNSAKGDKFLRAIKVRSTTSFGGEVKPSASRHKILWHANSTC